MLGQPNAREVLQHRARNISGFSSFFLMTLFLTFLVSAAFYSFTALNLDIASASTSAKDNVRDSARDLLSANGYGVAYLRRNPSGDLKKPTSWYGAATYEIHGADFIMSTVPNPNVKYVLGAKVGLKNYQQQKDRSWTDRIEGFSNAVEQGRMVQIAAVTDQKHAGYFAFKDDADAERFIALHTPPQLEQASSD